MGVRSDTIGGGVVAVLALLHLFLLQVGGFLGVLLLFAIWPLIGGAVASYLETASDGDSPITVGPVAGAFGAITVSVLVWLAGLGGMWSGFITTTFGVSLWPVSFAILVSFTVLWTVFGFVGSYLVAVGLGQ